LALGYEEIDLNPFVTRAFTPWSIRRSISDIYGATHKGNLPVSRYWGGYVSGTVEYPVGGLPPYTGLYGTYRGIQPEMLVWLKGDDASGIAPYDGTYEMASGGGHMLSDRMLVLDMPVGGDLTFWTWYDIEEDWDYGFVEASTDGGTTWMPLEGSITECRADINGSTAWANSLIAGEAESCMVITGSSGDWVEATFELPAASDVWVRFSYYTDEAYNGQGWFIDAVSVDGFSDGFEAGTDDWITDGWAWTTGLFPNDWVAGYVNPVYTRGKFDYTDVGYFDVPYHTGVDSFQYIMGAVDTLSLTRDEATVVIANRPSDSPFEAGYTLLVSKGSASDK